MSGHRSSTLSCLHIPCPADPPTPEKKLIWESRIQQFFRTCSRADNLIMLMKIPKSLPLIIYKNLMLDASEVLDNCGIQSAVILSWDQKSC